MNTTTAPSTTIVRFERGDDYVFRISKTFEDGTSDYIEGTACPADKAHAFFIEDEEPFVANLIRQLDRRHKMKMAPHPVG